MGAEIRARKAAFTLRRFPPADPNHLNGCLHLLVSFLPSSGNVDAILPKAFQVSLILIGLVVYLALEQRGFQCLSMMISCDLAVLKDELAKMRKLKEKCPMWEKNNALKC